MESATPFRMLVSNLRGEGCQDAMQMTPEEAVGLVITVSSELHLSLTSCR